ncbi:urotensin-2 receptor-like [Bombina bombina]|uniref:urotensin-2 receptor-like n=1 Tax=Bombina bombina TaxID=8345 RepID=UPI00235A97CE|nr:urotensin-2 receptor-like [Bombina bombina]
MFAHDGVNISADTSEALICDEEEILVTSSLSAVLASMFLLGIAGNLYVLAINMQSHKPSGSMSVHIINLALADLLYLSTIPFVVSTYLSQDWYFGDVGCRVLLSMDLFTMHASIFTLTVMSMERYQAVVFPLKARLAQGYHKITNLGIWIMSLLLTMPMICMIRLQESHYGYNKKICFPTWTPDAFRLYLTVLFCTSILGPGLVILYLYASLTRTYWTSGQQFPQSSRKLKQCIGCRIFTIILVYWACFVPFWAWQLAKFYQQEPLGLEPTRQIYLNLGVTCLTYGNSCVNPLLYTLLTQNYREYIASRVRGTNLA